MGNAITKDEAMAIVKQRVGQEPLPQEEMEYLQEVVTDSRAEFENGPWYRETRDRYGDGLEEANEPHYTYCYAFHDEMTGPWYEMVTRQYPWYGRTLESRIQLEIENTLLEWAVSGISITGNEDTDRETLDEIFFARSNFRKRKEVLFKELVAPYAGTIEVE